MARKTKYNTIVTDEKYNKINPENLTLLKEWLMYLKATNHAQTTILNYESDMNIFFVWLLDFSENKSFIDLKKRDIVHAQNHAMEEWEWGTARIRRWKDCLSSFSNFIENICDEDYPEFRNIIRKIESPGKKPVREKTVLEDNEVQDVFDVLIERKEYQLACLFALALYGGSRRSELLEFKIHYFDRENVVFGSLYKTPEPIRTKGKDGGKYIYKYTLKKPFDRYIHLWKRERKRLGIEDMESLFVSRVNGKYVPMKNTSMGYYADKINKILKENGVNKEFYWHACRHYFATFLKKQNLPDDVIIEVIGWEEANGGAMLSIYSDIPKDEKLGKYFNENGIVAHKQKELTEL